MGLKYPGKWKFEGVGAGIPDAAITEFNELILKTASGSQSVIESFKRAFGGSGTSSSYDWAVGDLWRSLTDRASNAALFVDNLWEGIEDAESRELPVPSHTFINAILAKHAIPLRIDPPNLIMANEGTIVDAGTTTHDPGEQLVAPFVLGDTIGSGGYGVVYRATRSTLVSDFEFAVKVLDPSPFVEDYDKALQRFKREIKALQSLQHRAIVQYFEAGLTRDRKPYVAMPLIQGVDLRAAASSTDLVGVVDMFIEILQALEYAHSKDIIHRDLKPRNIMIRSADLQPIILDFGSAYFLDQMDSKSLTTEAVGTIGYIRARCLLTPRNVRRFTTFTLVA